MILIESEIKIKENLKHKAIINLTATKDRRRYEVMKRRARHIIDSSPTHRQHDAYKLQYISTRTSAERSKKYAKMRRDDEDERYVDMLRSMEVIKRG